MDLPLTSYRHLGKRTLAVFMLRRSWVLVIILLVIGGLAGLLAVVPADYSSVATIVAGMGALLGAIAIAATASTAWLEYTHYGVMLGEADFKFKHGIVAEEELGIPYRRIKEVKVERSPLEMTLGVSSVVITVAEDEEDPRQSMITIEALDKKLASDLQEELLKRAEVETFQVKSATAGTST